MPMKRLVVFGVVIKFSYFFDSNNKRKRFFFCKVKLRSLLLFIAFFLLGNLGKRYEFISNPHIPLI